MTADDRHPTNSNPPPDKPSADRPQIVTSEELLKGQSELWIEHGGEMYRLRITARGKLYLTK